MLAFILAISLFSVSSDTIVVKGRENISYRLFASDSVLYFQHKINKSWSAPKIIDENISEYAMTITSGDYIHLVWCRDGRVFYKINYVPITSQVIRQGENPKWTYTEVISPYFTEPASDISIITRGNFIYVSWRSPKENDTRNYEYWRRSGQIRPGNLTYWYDPLNVTTE